MRRVRKTMLTNAPCATCGGTMRPVRASRYDISAELGIRAVLTGQVLGMQCPDCKAFAVPGTLLEAASDMAVMRLLEFDRRLAGTEATFLRKAALGISQTDLADRLGISRPTVARWETSTSLSPEHDFELRSLVVGELMTRARFANKRWAPADRVKLAAFLAQARRRPAPRRVPPMAIAA